MATKKKVDSKDERPSRFLIVRDDEVLSTEKTMDAALEFVNSEIDIDDPDDIDSISILEYVRVYDVVPSKVEEAIVDIDSYQY